MTDLDRETLMKMRSEIINKSTRSICFSCTKPVKTGKIMRYDDPITSQCRCEIIEPFVKELREVEAKLGLKR